MKATFALVPDDEIQHTLRDLSLAIHNVNPGAFQWVLLPFHVSLKQAFFLEDVAKVENYFLKFAATVDPVAVDFGNVEVFESVVWLPVEDDVELRKLHDRMNEELSAVVSDPSAPFDGRPYRFHLSIGFIREGHQFALPTSLPSSGDRLTFTKLALFLFDEYEGDQWQYATHRTSTLKHAH